MVIGIIFGVLFLGFAVYLAGYAHGRRLHDQVERCLRQHAREQEALLVTWHPERAVFNQQPVAPIPEPEVVARYKDIQDRHLNLD